MNESGCNARPVAKCEAVYRSSRCAASRDKHGLGEPKTNADRIRAMSDEELAEYLYRFTSVECQIPFCKNLEECNEILDAEGGIPEKLCISCLCDWLKGACEKKEERL